MRMPLVCVFGQPGHQKEAVAAEGLLPMDIPCPS